MPLSQLAPEGWIEDPKKGNNAGKDSLRPGDDWVEAPRNPDTTYVPENLKGTDYEQEIGNITGVLFNEGDKGFDQAVRASKGDLKWALETFKGINPDTAAKVYRIAKEQNIPFDTVHGNKDEWEKWQEASDIYRSLFNLTTNETGQEILKYPETVKWLVDPVKMAASRDDIQALTEIEKLMLAHKGSWARIAGYKFKEETKGLIQSGVGTVLAIHELLSEEAENANSLWEPSAYNVSSVYPVPVFKAVKNTGVMLEKILGPENREAVTGMLNILQNYFKPEQLPDTDRNLTEYTTDVIGMIPQVAAVIGSGLLAGPQAGAFFLGEHIFGSSYLSNRDQNISPERSATAALFNATAQAALEYLPVSKLLDALKTTGTSQAVKAFMEVLITDAGTEFLQAFPEEASVIWAQAEKDGKTLSEQVELFRSRLPETAKQGLYEAAVVAPMSIIGGTGKLMYEYARSKQHDLDIEFWDNIINVAENSKLRKRSPELFREYVDQAIRNTEVPENIYVPVEQFAQFYQNDKNEILKKAKQLGIEDQLEDAGVTGKDLEIPLSRWVAEEAGSDLSIALRGVIKFNPKGASIAEIAEAQKNIAKVLEDTRREYAEAVQKNELPQQLLDIRENLINSGMKAEDADANINVFLAGAQVLSRKTEETLTDWFNRVNPVLNIGGEAVQGVDDVVYNQEGKIILNDAFYKWFGDSKVVTDKGKPLVVYHGTPYTFDQFDITKTGKGHDQEGPGFYFTNDEEEASGYLQSGNRFSKQDAEQNKSQLVKAYISIKNPVPLTGKVNKNKVKQLVLKSLGLNNVNELDSYFEENEDAFWSSPLSNWGEEPYSAFNNVVASIMDYSTSPHDAFQRIWADVFGFDNTKHVKAMLEIGYDGVILKNEKHHWGNDHYIVFSPEQIKSVNNKGSWNPNDPRIMYQSQQPGQFYSRLLEASMELKQNKGTAVQMLNMLKKAPGVKAEELEWTGLEEWLAGKDSVMKEEITAFLRDKEVKVNKVEKKRHNPQISPVKINENFTLKGVTEDYAYIEFDPSEGDMDSIDTSLLYDFGSGGFLWSQKQIKYQDVFDAIDNIDDFEYVEEGINADEKNDILDFIDDQIVFQNVKGVVDDTKFSQYTLPNYDKNYREILITMPVIYKMPEGYTLKKTNFRYEIYDRYSVLTAYGNTEQDALKMLDRVSLKEISNKFRGGHFDEPNVLAHLRVNDRTDVQGKKTLFIEEIQSDWHEKGRRKGYIDGVPNAPFKKTWPELAFKQVLLMAVNEGYDQIAWTPGDVQNERYDLSKQVKDLSWGTNQLNEKVVNINFKNESNYSFGVDDNGTVFGSRHSEVEGRLLSDVLGKDVAKKITETESGKLEGDGLNIGGEGMRGFYDQIIPKTVQKLVSKYDKTVKVDTTFVRTTNAPDSVIDQYRNQPEHPFMKKAATKVWSVPITPKLREEVSKGLPLFQADRKRASYRIPLNEYLETTADFESFFDTKMSTKRPTVDTLIGYIAARGKIKITGNDYNFRDAQRDGLLQVVSLTEGRPIDEWVVMLAEDGIYFEDGDDLWEALKDPVRRQLNAEDTGAYDFEKYEREEQEQYLREAFENGFTEEEILAGFTPEFADRLRKNSRREIEKINRETPGLYAEADIERYVDGIVESTKQGFLLSFRAEAHRNAVETALAEGKKVPESVLADYADLVEKHKLSDQGVNETAGTVEDEYVPVTPLQPRGSVTFANGQTIINMYKASNMSTFLHELGHIFFNEMKRIVDLDLADDQLLKDFETVSNFIGDFDRTGQEKFARAFEAYLREGKAPSLKLTDAFRRFRDWLVSIYKSIRGLDVEINDDIRNVLDRLLASEREIEEAKNYYEVKKSFIDLVPATKKQKDTVKKKHKKADENALDKQVAKHMKAYFTATDGRAGIRERAKAEIEAMPVYAAMYDAIDNGGIRYSDVQQGYGSKIAQAINKKHSRLVRKKGKRELFDLAADYGYENVATLVEDLYNAEKKQDAIAARAKQIESEIENSVRESLERGETVKGDEAFHGDARLEALIAEAAILEERIAKQEQRKPRIIEARAVRDAAAEILGKETLGRATRYDLYAKTEQKWAKASFEAAEAGDIIKAHRAKKMQALNHALVQEAIRIRDEKSDMEKTAKRLEKLQPKTTEFAFREAILAILNRYGLSGKKPQKPENVNIGDLVNSVDEMEGTTLPVADWIVNMTGPETYKDLSVTQARELFNAIKTLAKAGRKDLRSKYLSGLLKDMLGIDGDVFVEDIVDRLTEPMNTLKDRLPVDRTHWFHGPQKFKRSVIANLNLTPILAKEMDAYAGFGVEGKRGLNETILLRALAQADSENKALWDKMVAPELEGNGEIIKALQNIKNRLEKTYGKKFLLQDLPLALEGTNTFTRLRQNGDNFWTAERVICAALNIGNEGNIKALKEGFGWDDSHIAKLKNVLSVDEWNTIQNIWNFMDRFYPLMDDVYFRVNDVHTKKVEAQGFSISTEDGGTVEFEGGYYPLIFDHGLSDKAARNKEEDLMKNRIDAIFHSASTKSGHTVERKGGTLPPNLRIDVLYTHLRDVTKYITHTEIIRDLDRITKDPVWSGSVRSKFGNDAYNEMREWLKFVARPQIKPHTWLDRVLTRYRHLSTLYALGYNLKTGVKQTLSFTSAAQEIGWRNAFSGVNSLVQHRSGLVEDINSMSSYMSNRAKSVDREVREQLQRIKIFDKKIQVGDKRFGLKDVQDLGFIFVRGFDAITVYSVWHGAFNKYMSENLNKDLTKRKSEAIAYADDIVATTQPSARDMDLSHWQRGTGAERLLSQFMTWTLKYGARTRAYFRGWREGKISNKDYMRHIFNEQILPVMGVYIIESAYAALMGYDDEDDNFFWDLFSTGVGQLISGYPILNQAPSMIKFGKSVEPPALRPIQVQAKALKRVWGLLGDDEDKFKKAAYALGQLTESETGIPWLKVSKQILKAIENIGDK